MKKTYINPEMVIVKMAGKAQILAGSELPTGTTPTNPNSSDSRRSYLWDDDDEE